MKKDITKQEYGRLCREKLLEHFKNDWGSYNKLRPSLFEFSNGQKILALYASSTKVRWWYGVSKQYWENWDDKIHMVFLMRKESECTYAMLSPKDSIELLDMIKPAQDSQKKINIRIPLGPGKIYIQEWQDFPFAHEVRSLGEIVN